MIALWILLALVLLIVLICLLRVGVDASYEDDVLTLKVVAGPVKLTILPKKPRKKPKKEKKKKEKKPKKKKPKKPKKEKEKKKLSLSFLIGVAKLALQAVNTFRRKLHVDVFRLVFIAGGSDPYDVAMLAGRVRAALDGLYPLARKALVIREREVRVGADFLADKPAFAGRLKLTIRIGQVLGIGLVFAWKALMLLLKDRKKHKNDPPKKEKLKKKQAETTDPIPTEQDAPAAPPEERNNEDGT